MNLKIRHLSILIIAIILYSIPILSFHHHDDLKAPDCAICKFADDFSSGDRAAPQSLITPSFVLICFASDTFIQIVETMTISVITRAPPVYIPS